MVIRATAMVARNGRETTMERGEQRRAAVSMAAEGQEPASAASFQPLVIDQNSIGSLFAGDEMEKHARYFQPGSKMLRSR